MTNIPRYPTLSDEPVEFVVSESETGQRLDALLTVHFHNYSRGHLRRVISAGGVLVDDRGGKPAYRVRAGQTVRIILPEIPRQSPRPEAIPLEILFEDEDLVVVNKPPGMVVHPARGHWSGTLVSALQYHFGPSLSSSGGPLRPGIVHRLDRDTSGAILVARHDQAHFQLAAQFQSRSIEKEYFALVAGTPELDSDIIDRSIAVHPVHREKMTIVRHPQADHDHASTVPGMVPARQEGRTAQTFYRVVERFRGFAAVRAMPKTGRTHQIRVHLAHIGLPVLCDRAYGHRAELTRGELSGDASDTTVLLNRQALHAQRLRFLHPRSGELLEIEAPLPADITAALAALREFR